MKKYIFILFAITAVLGGCKKNDWLDWKAQNELWLEQNKLNHANDEKFHVSETGLQYRIIYEGNPTDAKPNVGSTVIVSYEGKLINGARFDGGTSQFAVQDLTAGFAEGLKKIHNPGIIDIYVPYDLAYGDTGAGSEGTSTFIPPYSTLIFHIELKAIQ